MLRISEGLKGSEGEEIALDSGSSFQTTESDLIWARCIIILAAM
jgi:hypothetical protein